MKNRWMFPFGMIAVISFLFLTGLGRILWPGYNPVTSYVSVLIADGAPNANLMRGLLNAYSICFLVFSLAMAVSAFRRHNTYAKIGFIVLFVTALISAVGYGSYPISMIIILSKNNIAHLLVTISLLAATALSILLIAIGYMRQENRRALGRFCLAVLIFFVVVNLWHLYAILHGHNIVGFIERLTFYAFLALIAVLSWIYTFRRNVTADGALAA